MAHSSPSTVKSGANATMSVTPSHTHRNLTHQANFQQIFASACAARRASPDRGRPIPPQEKCLQHTEKKQAKEAREKWQVVLTKEVKMHIFSSVDRDMHQNTHLEKKGTNDA